MAQNVYYNNPANEKLGKIFIGLPVFNLIAEKSINEIEGVHVSGKNGVICELDGTNLTMSINAKISYGTLASKASKQIQERVARAILEMSNVSPKAINVNVIGIEF